MTNERRYSIGKVGKICDIPIKTLRYYDSINLIVPHFRDSQSKYRYYSKEQIMTIFTIRKLRMLGFGLKEIHNIINNNKANILEESIDIKLEEISNEIKKLNQKYFEGYAFSQRLKKGVDILSLYSKDEESSKDIIIEEIPKSYLLFTKKIMKNYSNKEVSLEQLIEIMNLSSKLNVNSKGPLTIIYNCNPLDQFLCKDINIEFGIYLESPIESVNCKKFGGFTAATAIHIGDYSNLMQTHIEMIQYINKNGYKINGRISEDYIISPFDVNNPSELVTKIIIPVEKI